MEPTDEPVELVERVVALDLGKAGLVACVRAKTDELDAVWLAKVAERGMCSPSLVHPRPIRQLRDLTRYRRSLVRERTREKQRCEKLLEDAQIKLSSVISDIVGVSGRARLAAMIAGQRTPAVLAQMARGSMRSKTAVLEEALTGHFEDHHAFLTGRMLDRIDALTADIDAVGVRIEAVIAPFFLAMMSSAWMRSSGSV